MPAELLRHTAPWSAGYTPEQRPPWNPLMYDSVGQFYPWRKFASEIIRSGTIPLWNPYQFCGAPFVANSQSAVFYPGNLLYYALPTTTAAGWSVILHLTLAAAFMWLFVRGLGISPGAAIISGIAFAYSTWQIAWLHLPTFLTTSCWLPLLMLMVYRLFESGRRRYALGIGFAAAMALLAGHLQIAFYSLLAAGLLIMWLFAARARSRKLDSAWKCLWYAALGLAVGGAVAAPQLLPTMELSRYSHRAARPTKEGFEAYRAYAVSASSAPLLVMPDFFGNPSNPRNPYFGASREGMPFNYAENAGYVGMGALLLALFALTGLRASHPLTWFFALLAGLSGAMALGTFVSEALYFGIPGFASSGSPGRALVLFAFSMSSLAGIGYHLLISSPGSHTRRAILAVAGMLVIWVVAYLTGLNSVREIEGAAETIGRQIPQQAGFTILSALAVLALAAKAGSRPWLKALPCLVLAVDLFSNGSNYNPTAAREEVYPITPAIARLQEVSGHERIMPVNSDWRFFPGPTAAMPPNSAMVYGLRDMQGYDSLFPGRYKEFLNRTLGTDASPREVGNMVFVRSENEDLARKAGARFVIKPEGGGMTMRDLGDSAKRAALTPEGGLEWIIDGVSRIQLKVNAAGDSLLRLADQHYPGWKAEVDGSPVRIQRSDQVFRAIRVPAGVHTVTFTYRPAGFQVGLFLMATALGIGGFAVGFTFAGRRGHALSAI